MRGGTPRPSPAPSRGCLRWAEGGRRGCWCRQRVKTEQEEKAGGAGIEVLDQWTRWYVRARLRQNYGTCLRMHTMASPPTSTVLCVNRPEKQQLCMCAANSEWGEDHTRMAANAARIDAISHPSPSILQRLLDRCPLQPSRCPTPVPVCSPRCAAAIRAI